MNTVLYAAPGRPRALLVLVAGLLLAVLVSAVFVSDGPGLDSSASPRVAEEREEHEELLDEAVDSGDLPHDTLMVWAGARLGEGYADAVADADDVGPSVVVHGEVLQLVQTRRADGEIVDELPDGWSYPVEVLATAPARFDVVAGREVLGDLAADEAVLSETSAEVRGLEVGDRLEFQDGTELRVADVLPDELVGAAEVLVSLESALPLETEKFLLVADGDERAAERLLELATDEREPRVVDHGSVPVLRHAHGVLPSAQRKLHFGEFAMQDLSGRNIRPGQSWVDEHIVATSVPIIGRVQCHEKLIEPLRAAMQELSERGAAHVIDSYAGCWVPRRSGASGPLSSHAWGISIDFNAQANPYSGVPNQPDVLVEVMSEHGFLWGGDWDVPDAMHFELAPGRDTAR